VSSNLAAGVRIAIAIVLPFWTLVAIAVAGLVYGG
jgi:hypothetical protein